MNSFGMASFAHSLDNIPDLTEKDIEQIREDLEGEAQDTESLFKSKLQNDSFFRTYMNHPYYQAAIDNLHYLIKFLPYHQKIGVINKDGARTPVSVLMKEQANYNAFRNRITYDPFDGSPNPPKLTHEMFHAFQAARGLMYVYSENLIEGMTAYVNKKKFWKNADEYRVQREAFEDLIDKYGMDEVWSPSDPIRINEDFNRFLRIRYEKERQFYVA